MDTVEPMRFDPELGRFVAAPGVSRTRGEGWARSRIGEHGIRGLPDGRLPAGPKVVFWGDSFVEAVQVDDADRMAQVFSNLARHEGLAVSGVGIGKGGDSLIDSYFKLPDYAPVLGPVSLNVFFLGKTDDVLPDAPSPCRATFTSMPWRLAPGYCPPSTLALRLAPILREMELSAAFKIWTRLRDQNWRLGPGPTRRSDTAAVLENMNPAFQNVVFLIAAWDFLLARLREQARGPVLLVYAPIVPRVEGGAIRFDDPSGFVAELFAQACAYHGIGFVNLGPAFVAHYQATGLFPYGFFNSPPGTGHLNTDGHRIVAQVVYKYILEHRDALLAR